MDLKIKWLQIFLVSAIICGLNCADDMRCFVCSSYMEQCKEYVHTNQGYAHRGRCYTKCFVRLGEDKAIYRGCFDAFREVPYLTNDYTGCKNQTWNGQTLPWCFCEGDLCNKVSMNDLGYEAELDFSQGYRVNGHDEGVYPDLYETSHYVDEMEKYDEIPSGNVAYQNVQSQSYNHHQQQQDKSYGFKNDQKENSYKVSHENNYAKEGYNDVDGYEIKDVEHANIDIKKLDKFMEDYYSDNSHGQEYGQDYNSFHYYQVDDPDAYKDDIHKYISMDESEGIKMAPKTNADHELHEESRKSPEVKDNEKKSYKGDVPTDKKKVEKVYLEDEYIRNNNGGLYTESHNNKYVQQQSLAQSNQFNEPHATSSNSQGYNNNRRESGRMLKDEFKGQNKHEEFYDDEEEEPYYFPPHLAERIECAKTGFYQNPEDCRTFVACILDPRVKKPYMHLMRCPEGLVWDNTDKICNKYSTTCNVGGVIDESYDLEETYGAPVHEEPHIKSQQHKEDFIKYAGEN